MIPDRIKGVGALGGLYTALADAPTEQVLVIACDMPFLAAPFLTRLVTTHVKTHDDYARVCCAETVAAADR